jgi:hypothetical protein
VYNLVGCHIKGAVAGSGVELYAFGEKKYLDALEGEIENLDPMVSRSSPISRSHS